MKILLESVADADRAANDGVTPLFIASQEGKLEVVKYLVEEGKAEVEKAERIGCTSLKIASQNSHLKLVKYLVEERKVAMDNGSTPLYIAKAEYHKGIVKYMKGKGAKE